MGLQADVVLVTADLDIDQQREDRDNRQDGGKGTGSSVVAAVDLHIGAHGKRNGFIVVKNDGTGQFRHDGNPAQDRTGDDAA